MLTQKMKWKRLIVIINSDFQVKHRKMYILCPSLSSNVKYSRPPLEFYCSYFNFLWPILKCDTMLLFVHFSVTKYVCILLTKIFLCCQRGFISQNIYILLNTATYKLLLWLKFSFPFLLFITLIECYPVANIPIHQWCPARHKY